jgi:hypothetical protein
VDAPLTPRRVAGLLATPGCERRSRLVATGVDLDSLAGLSRDERSREEPGVHSGQSPFALARSAQLQARLRSDGYADLRALISEHLGVEVAGVSESQLADCLADTSPTLHLLGPQTLDWPPSPLPLPAPFPAGSGISAESWAKIRPGSLIRPETGVRPETGGGGLEVDSLMIVSGERLHLVGVRTYAMVGDVADPAKVAATSRELATILVALGRERCSTRTLLVLPKNFGLRPTAAVLDVAPQVARVRALAASLEWGGEPVELADLAPKFGDGCPQCPLMATCAGELAHERRVARLGGAVANVVDGHATVDEALLDPPPDQLVRLRLTAMQQGRAVRRATRRHAHLAAEPLVVVGYHLAGEPAAVLALQYGTSPDSAKLLVAAEPRDREQRMALLREFAADLITQVDAFDAVEPVVRRDMTVVECAVDAPQLITPNGSTAQWVADLLGRYVRATSIDVLEAAGRHLSWFASRRVLPGSDALLTATGLLTTHWVTGQLPAEDVHLPSLLTWISDSTITDVPMGPISDPHWDAAVLAPAIGSPDAVRAVVAAQLAPAWVQTWQALDLVRTALPEIGAHVAERWERDRWSFTRHRERIAEGTAAITARLSGVPAYRFLHELETRTVALERQMALDDPLIMAGYLISGDALAGTVSKVDREHTLASPTGRELLRPRIWVACDGDFGKPVGTQLWLAADPRVMVTVAAVEPGGVELVVQKGAVQRTALGRLPQIGDEVVFAPFGGEDVFPSRLPEHLPWQFGDVSTAEQVPVSERITDLRVILAHDYTQIRDPAGRESRVEPDE